jgi:NADH-quinone oxidoreductase subunit L
MGGLRKQMPVTFATYAIGMVALAGVIPFAGFWSKDEILHSAAHWHPSKVPFLLGLAGAFLTAFYMTRQMMYVFFGRSRLHGTPHESPKPMTVPLMILAVCSVLLGFLATPGWPWLHTYLTGEPAPAAPAGQFLLLALLSTLIVGAGIASGWYLYRTIGSQDPLDARFPALFGSFRNRFWVDEAYEATVLRFARWLSFSFARLEIVFFASISSAAALVTLAFGWLSRLFDHFVIDFGFDTGCRAVAEGANAGKKIQNGRIQTYLRTIALTLAVLVLVLAWGCKGA